MGENKEERDTTQAETQQAQGDEVEAQPAGEAAYTTKDITELLGVAASTIRKYSIALEDAGFDITRNAMDRRVFRDKDVEILRKVRDLVTAGTTVENAVRAAMAGEAQVPAPRNEADVRLRAYVEAQARETAELHRKLDTLIDEITDLREERAEEKQALLQIAAAQEKAEVQASERVETPVRKGGILSRLFKTDKGSR